MATVETFTLVPMGLAVAEQTSSERSHCSVSHSLGEWVPEVMSLLGEEGQVGKKIPKLNG